MTHPIRALYDNLPARADRPALFDGDVALTHGDLIALPYAVSDTYSNFTTIKISRLLETMRPIGAIMPKDETTAIGLDGLVRRDAEIQIGTARAGSPARAKVIDVHGQAHFVMVEPHDQTLALNAGDTVLLVRREGQTFYGVHYESPLLGL